MVSIWIIYGWSMDLLGGFNPSENYESQLGWLFPIYGKIKNVPNHQPEMDDLEVPKSWLRTPHPLWAQHHHKCCFRFVLRNHMPCATDGDVVKIRDVARGIATHFPWHLNRWSWLENHRKTIGTWWFNGIWWDLPSGNDWHSYGKSLFE